jgi:hypothetical protein
VVRENSWGPTTGKHLNAIDRGNKKGRVSSDQFESLYQTAMENPRLDYESFGQKIREVAHSEQCVKEALIA